MLHQQAWAFAIAFLSGIAAGTVFDIYRVIRQAMGLRKIGTAIGDFVALTLTALLTFMLLLFGNWAELRIYVALAIVCGLAIYLRAASLWVRRTVVSIFRFTAWLIRIMVTGIVLPFHFLVMLLGYPLALLNWLGVLSIRIIQYLVSFPYFKFLKAYGNWINRKPPEQF